MTTSTRAPGRDSTPESQRLFTGAAEGGAAHASEATSRGKPLGQPAAVLVGALCGLVWAAGLRGWMVELVGRDSRFTWMTVAFVLLPGAVLGALLGSAAYGRPLRTHTHRWLALSPLLLATALLDPAIFHALITTGEGSGSLIVVFTALAGGFVLGRSRWSVGRVLAAVVAASGLLLLGFMGTMAGPLTGARVAWVCLLGLSLMLVLCAAASLPYPKRRWRRWQLVTLGAVSGLAWAGALRSFMAAVAGAESGVTWVLTFGFVLLPGAVVGSLLGLALHLRSRGDGRWRWRLAWSPMLFAAVLFSDPAHLSDVLADGIGAGAAAVPLIAVLGGYAVSGRGRPWLRALGGLVYATASGGWLLTATSVGGPDFALSRPHGLWASVLFVGLLGLLALGASVPMRTECAPAPSATPSASSRRSPGPHSPARR